MVEPIERESNSDKISAAMQEEVDSILAWKKTVQDKAEDSDILLAIGLLDIGTGIITEKQIAVERDGKESREGWTVVRQMKQPQDIKETLPVGFRQTIEGLASKIEISEDTVFDATIKTRTLVDNFIGDQPIFLEFGNGPEGLRLKSSYFQDSRTKQAVKIGYILEYYSSFGTVEGEKPLSLLVHSNLEDLSFGVLFPHILVFTSHVSSKKNQVEKGMSL